MLNVPLFSYIFCYINKFRLISLVCILFPFAKGCRIRLPTLHYIISVQESEDDEMSALSSLLPATPGAVPSLLSLPEYSSCLKV